MLAFKYRFHGHNSLRFVYKNGLATRSKLMTIKSTTNPNRKLPRVSVVISKKVLKGAVKRNRVRRVLYELIRNRLDKIKPGTDLVVIVTSGEVLSIDNNSLAATLDELFASAGVCKTP